ncbi:hypothetical protein AAIH46_08210 [Rhizobium sp. 0TCS1.26]|uniref:hypothetical protein n=1 Tax=Rhizobium sp. 0TCS1.26 TaxID=3142623 RepID=UPI003D2DA4B6
MMANAPTSIRSFVRHGLVACGLAFTTLTATGSLPALALSGTTAQSAEPAPQTTPPATGLPLPDPMVKQSQAPATTPSAGEAPAAGAPAAATPKIDILHDLSKLPDAVQKTRQALAEAAASGDIERLRPLMSFDADVMQQLQADGGDPVEAFKSLSGDPDGLEILAIILDVLQTGAAHVGVGTADEMYVWPYFVGKPVTGLSAPERVELLRLITAGDLVAMEETNNYNFYRLGITPDGRWRLFAGGD